MATAVRSRHHGRRQVHSPVAMAIAVRSRHWNKRQTQALSSCHGNSSALSALQHETDSSTLQLPWQQQCALGTAARDKFTLQLPWQQQCALGTIARDRLTHSQAWSCLRCLRCPLLTATVKNTNYVECCLQAHEDAVWFLYEQMFRRNIWPPCWGRRTADAPSLHVGFVSRRSGKRSSCNGRSLLCLCTDCGNIGEIVASSNVMISFPQRAAV
jgi:hypothetical protein